MELSRELVFEFIESESPFPIDFEQAWQWIGYTRKDNAKRVLDENFETELDFSSLMRKSPMGRPTELIKLSLDCFKQLAMMAGTEKGQEVRRYFINCETELKRRIVDERKQREELVREAYVSKTHSRWQKIFTGPFYQETCRLNGWNYDPKTCRGPRYLAQITNDVVYSRLQPGVLEELQERNPVMPYGKRKHRNHQYLTVPLGNPHLREHLRGVTRLMKGCASWTSFKTLLDQFYPVANEIQVEALLDLAGESFEDWEKLLAS